MAMVQVRFLEGVPAQAVLERLSRAAGKELESGKFSSEESSAALAVNAFGWFLERPSLLPCLPGAPSWTVVENVEVEYCARFPWAGGRHPWLDAAFETETHLIGVESKRFEPFRDKKVPALSPAYDRPVWGERMDPFTSMRDTLRANPTAFRLLDAAQLVKHAFGLVTDARRRGKLPHLHYLYAEPVSRGGKAIAEELRQRHRRETQEFSDAVAGAEVTFSACSYREWLSAWREGEVAAHAQRLVQAFEP
jgi:hypothetical protein